MTSLMLRLVVEMMLLSDGYSLVEAVIGVLPLDSGG